VYSTLNLNGRATIRFVNWSEIDVNSKFDEFNLFIIMKFKSYGILSSRSTHRRYLCAGF
jgi:hypothetical protein